MRQPTKFGKYLLLERIAVGGMAEVFVAKAFGVEGFERLLAIKKILPTMGEDAEFISMFVDEARIAVQLSHANVVQVLELGKHDENLYIAMEYISGRDLRQVIERFRKRQQPMPIPQGCLIVAEVCEALDYAHRKKDARGHPLGIVHRDVSPQNVIVSFDGEVKLIDFGIAKAESRLQKTQAGILKGKFSYMSPEQVKGQPIDGRSDIFAAGILLWELLCGQKLFTGDSDFAILEKVRNGLVPSPRSVSRTIPEALERVIFKALATDPKDRYHVASELHDDLMRFTLSGDTVYGTRQLAQWLREEFKADFEKEQARLGSWLSPPVMVSADTGITPIDPFPGPAFLAEVNKAQAEITQQWRIKPDQDTLVLPPTPPRGSTPLKRTEDAQELPTMKMSDDELILAERELAARQQPAPPPLPAPGFDFADERTNAPRAQRKGAMTKSLKEQKQTAEASKRRWALWSGAPLALIVLLGGWYLWPEQEMRPGKVIVTPQPSVTADLIIDGKPSGQLPPFVHTLAPGKHKIEVRADGYRTWATSVQVPSGGRPVEVDAQLTTEKPMEVEGVVLTQKPPAQESTAQEAKKKRLLAKKAALPPRKAEAEPQPEPADDDPSPRLRVVTDPPGASVSIDGRSVGRSPVTTEAMDPGPVHVVIASLDGYAPARRATKLDGIGVTDLKLSLSQSGPVVAEAGTAPPSAVGYLTAETKPSSKLTIDGRDTGRWTPVPKANPIALPAGAHTVVFESADGRRLEERLEIEPGKTQRLIRSLP
jgi:serine/threonine protein kinase